MAAGEADLDGAAAGEAGLAGAAGAVVGEAGLAGAVVGEADLQVCRGGDGLEVACWPSDKSSTSLGPGTCCGVTTCMVHTSTATCMMHRHSLQCSDTVSSRRTH